MRRSRLAYAGWVAVVIAAGLRAFVARTRVDEVVIASSMYDHDARKHSLALTMAAAEQL